MRFGTRVTCIATLAAALLGGRESGAQEAAGFALNRFEPSERGSDWFAVESLDLRGDQRFAVGLVLDYARKPLVLYDPDGNEAAALVSDQLYGHVGGAVTLYDRLRLGLNLPVMIWQDGEPGQAGAVTVQPSGDSGIGDIRLSGDVRVVGEYGDPFTLAGGIRVYAPTGSQQGFTGEGNLRLGARAMAAGRVSAFVYGAGLGFDFKNRNEDFAGEPRGSEVAFNAAAGVILLDDRLIVGPEIFGATVVTSSDALFSRTATPLEALLGGHYRFHPDFQAGLGAGGGLSRGFGTPQLRAVASITWFPAYEQAPPPPPPPPDRDGDGVVDPEDACPDEPGVPTDDPRTNGCPPPPPDRDGDRILDDVDACPDQAGVPSKDPGKHGCPPPGDRDGDTIVDPEDACPDEPGIPTEDPATHGCPDPDRDHDGIPNEPDACPDDPGEPNEDPKKHGCPAARVVKDHIEIREQVQFAYNSDRILKASDSTLEAVRKILAENPQIKKVSIEGHTDSKGSEVYNRALSSRRAAAVVAWLVKHGIDESRLDSIGYGEAMPIADNETEEGRADNRRVEIRIVEQDTTAPEKAPSAPEQEAPGESDEEAK